MTSIMTDGTVNDITDGELARHGAAMCLVGDQLFVWRGANYTYVDKNAMYVLNVNSKLDSSISISIIKDRLKAQPVKPVHIQVITIK